jgi:hypothetical protein
MTYIFQNWMASERRYAKMELQSTSIFQPTYIWLLLHNMYPAISDKNSDKTITCYDKVIYQMKAHVMHFSS